MLTLVRDCSNPKGESQGANRPAQYIILKEQGTGFGGGCNFGRGLKNDFRLIYPWLSRKHLTITKSGQRHVLTSQGKRGVYVNSVKVATHTLKNGDLITIGGSDTGAALGAAFPEKHGPHLVYKYSKKIITVDDPSGLYKAPVVKPEDIIRLEDSNFLGNSVRMEEYHAEDFNATDTETLYESPRSGSVSTSTSKPRKRRKTAADPPMDINCPSTSAAGDIPMQRGPSSSAARELQGASSSSAPCDPEDTIASLLDDVKANDPPKSVQQRIDLLQNAAVKINCEIKDVTGKVKETLSRPNSREASSERSTPVPKRDVPRRAKKRSIVIESEESDDECDISVSQGAKSVKSESSTSIARNSSPVVGQEPPDSLTLPGTSKTSSRKRKSAGKKATAAAEDKDDNWLVRLQKGGKGTSKGGGKGKGKAKKAAVVDSATKQEVKEWIRPSFPQPKKSRMVSIVKTKGFIGNYKFENSTIFELNGGDSAPYSSYDDLELKVDLPKLEYALITDSLSKDDKDKFFRLVSAAYLKMMSMDDFQKPRCPAYEAPVPQPPEIGIEMKEYQRKTIAWMTKVEKRVNEDWVVSKLVPLKKGKCKLLLDADGKLAFRPPVKNSPRTTFSVRCKGGILADEMGLGKTITLLGLLVNHRAEDFPKIPDASEFDPLKGHFPCHATLVVAPSHLTGQWKTEIESHAPSLKVILITTKVNFDKTRYIDVLEADIVIVSVQFLLTNKIYTHRPTGKQAECEFITFLNKPGINPLLQTNPNLCHFDWWRLVSDEAHELLTFESDRKGAERMSSGLSLLSQIPARHRWYMTGTPFPNGINSLRAALKFLQLTVDDPNLIDSLGALNMLCNVATPVVELIRENFYVRNTKESIGFEYDVPEYVEELMLLTMSRVERGIYDRAYGERSRRQVCCHLQLDNQMGNIMGSQQKTLEEVKVVMVQHAKKSLEASKGNILRSQDELKKLWNDFAAETLTHKRNILQSRIDNRKKDIQYYEEQVKKHESSISYFESIMPRITHSAEEPCVICLENIENITVTPCGHLFCYNCIKPCVDLQQQCPTCRQPVRASQLIEVKDKEEKENLTKKLELENLTEKFGTKMAYLIFYLRYLFKANSDARVIIFSQWDSMLHKIGDTLKQNAINNVFVKGNVHCRNKAINSFRKQNESRVIMLSLEHAASGTNLVEASHVILIDPVAGTKSQANAVEAQAIGRAHRMGQNKQIVVARMIMKDTIEHELYKRNNDEDIQQVEFEFENQESEKKKLGVDGVQIVRTIRKVPPPADPKAAALAIASSASVRDDPERRPAATFFSYGNDMDDLMMGIGANYRYYDSDDYEERDSYDESDDDDGAGTDCESLGRLFRSDLSSESDTEWVAQ